MRLLIALSFLFLGFSQMEGAINFKEQGLKILNECGKCNQPCKQCGKRHAGTPCPKK